VTYQSLIVTLNLSPIVVEILTFKDRKQLVFLTLPLFVAAHRGDPLEFLDETYPAKIGLPYGKNL